MFMEMDIYFRNIALTSFNAHSYASISLCAEEEASS
jgi:hypothetical protein